MTVNTHMSEAIKNNVTVIQQIDSVKAYHERVDNNDRIRRNEAILSHNKKRTELNELMLELYHARIDRLLTYNQYASVIKPLIDQGKIIDIEA